MASDARQPVVVIVGRPNVGKSTLFNRLCGGRRALVADYAGLTRDRHYGRAVLDGRAATLIDTGGLAAAPPSGKFSAEEGAIAAQVAAQADLALDEAHLALVVVDARAGLAAGDQAIVAKLRRRGLASVVAVNKIDGAPAEAAFEFAGLGMECVAVSATHGRGMAALARAAAARLPDGERGAAKEPPGIRLAVVGRPNVGKSTLVNRLLGAERQLVFDQPGTTRDAIDIPFGDFLLIDTAGVRRKGRVSQAVETLSIVKTLDALARAHVAVLVVDGGEGIVEQDLHVLRYALDSGAGALLAVNKRDALDAAGLRAAKASAERRLAFAPWLPVRYVSALRGAGVADLLHDARRIHRAGAFDVDTPALNRILADAIADHPPPLVRSRPVKLRYANKVGEHPPAIVIHGNQTEALPTAYRRFLANRFREALDLTGVPVVIRTQTTANPFAGRRNPLSRRQRKSRERLIRHRRGR